MSQNASPIAMRNASLAILRGSVSFRPPPYAGCKGVDMPEQGEVHTVVLEQQSHGAHSEAEAKFASERQAFWAMHAQLVSMYEGKYVAVLHGQVVDSDGDERALV